MIKKFNCIIKGIGEFNSGEINLKIEEINSAENVFKNSANSIYADLSDYNLDFELRNRNDGDIICTGGTKKLKKYLNEKKIPNHEKDSLLFLAQGKEILWAIGLGISDKIKVKTKPTHKITINRSRYGT